MVFRWVAAGVLEAAKGFRRVQGCQDMPALVAALRARDAAVRTRGVVRDGCVVVNQAAAEFQQRTGHPPGPGRPLLATAKAARITGAISLVRVTSQDDILLLYEMNGEPLPLNHDGPLRLGVPGWYGVA